MTQNITTAQREALLQPINPRRVLVANRQSHIPAYDVAAHLTRIFDFGGWDKEIISLTLINEEPIMMGEEKNRPGWTCTYSCTLRLTVKDANGKPIAFWEDGACGTSNLPNKGEAHDMALKSAISYALKRCAAFGLGDQFGLSLYNKGKTEALVRVLVGQGDVTNASPKPESMGNDEKQDESAEGQPNPDFSDPLNDLIEGFRALQFTRSAVFEFVRDTLGETEEWNGELSDLSDPQLVRLLRALEDWVTQNA